MLNEVGQQEVPRIKAALPPLQTVVRGRHMVFAVQCPNPRCKKFMLVEEHDRGKSIACLICKSVIKIAGDAKPAGAGKKDG
jgi:hypothetical protein